MILNAPTGARKIWARVNQPVSTRSSLCARERPYKKLSNKCSLVPGIKHLTQWNRQHAQGSCDVAPDIIPQNLRNVELKYKRSDCEHVYPTNHESEEETGSKNIKPFENDS